MNAHRMHIGRAATRMIAMLLCVGVLSIAFLASVFVETRSAHAHDASGPSGRCATCQQIAAAQTFVRRLQAPPPAAQRAIAALIVCAILAWTAHARASAISLVSLNIRMND